MKIHLHIFRWIGVDREKAWYRCRCGEEMFNHSQKWNLDDDYSLYAIKITL